MGDTNKVTEEILGKKPKYVESDKEKEIQAAVNRALEIMDENPMYNEMRVSLSEPYRKFINTMFPGIENVAGGIVASSVNSLHIQIIQPPNHPRLAYLRQKLFRCDMDFVFTETDNFNVFLLPLRDKSVSTEEEVSTDGDEDSGETTETFVDSDADLPKRLAVSMVYDLSSDYKSQIEAFQKESLDLIQQFCTLRDGDITSGEDDE